MQSTINFNNDLLSTIYKQMNNRIKMTGVFFNWAFDIFLYLGVIKQQQRRINITVNKNRFKLVPKIIDYK